MGIFNETRMITDTYVNWRRKWQPTPVPLPGEAHGQGSLVGYSPWGHKESDMTERLHTMCVAYLLYVVYIFF